MTYNVLSIRQPWAALIVHGIKDVENRTWKTKKRGPFLVHASKKVEKELIDYYVNLYPEIKETVKITGSIIGRGYLVDCVENSRSEWFSGQIGFIIGKAELIKPIQASGRLSFWLFHGEVEPLAG
jgi:hypothetical protein